MNRTLLTYSYNHYIVIIQSTDTGSQRIAMRLTNNLLLTFSPSCRPVPPSRGPPHGARYRFPGVPLTPASTGFNEDRHRRFLTPCSIDSVIGHIKRWCCIRCRVRQWSQIISAHVGDFQSRISGRNVSFSSSSFEFWRVSTAAWQQWTLDSDSEPDFDGFVTVEFGENGHFAANLAPETMWN